LSTIDKQTTDLDSFRVQHHSMFSAQRINIRPRINLHHNANKRKTTHTNTKHIITRNPNTHKTLTNLVALQQKVFGGFEQLLQIGRIASKRVHVLIEHAVVTRQ
jgi:hypothetical protein